MKRILLLALLLFTIGGTTSAYSQSFLKKLKEKAEKVSGKILGDQQQTQELPIETLSQDTENYNREDNNPALGPNHPEAPRILTFAIGSEQGVIDHEQGRIEVTVDQNIDFNNIAPVFTVGTNAGASGSGINASPASGTRLDPNKDPYFTVIDNQSRSRVYELILHIRGMEIKDLRAGIKQGTMKMTNSMQGFPAAPVIYYFDDYGQMFAMMTNMGTGTIYDYRNNKVILLSAVMTVEKVRETVNKVAADLQTVELKGPTMKELEDAMKNGLKDVEYVYDIYEIPNLAGKLECPLLNNYEAMPEKFLAWSNGRRLPNTTTVAGKPCATFEFRNPESGMAMTYYSWKNINFGGGMKGIVWGQVDSFSESVPAGIFTVPKNYRPHAEYMAEVNAIAEAGGKKFRQHTQQFENIPEFQAIKRFLEAEARAQGITPDF